MPGPAVGGLHVQHLQELERLGARRGAQVQHAVLRLHVQHQRRDHADGLLPGDGAHVVGLDHELMQRLHVLGLLERVLGDVDLPRQAVGSLRTSTRTEIGRARLTHLQTSG